MIHPILDDHEAIAWDMDGTLVEGPNAEMFRDYIRANPHKRHHVITFRNKNWAMDVWGELTGHGLDAANLIRSVESCPQMVHDCYMLEKRFGGADERRRYYNGPEITRAEWYEHVERFPKWKAERAQQIGCTILVDDMPQWVVAGCKEYAVTFLHAHHDWPTAS